MSITTIFDNVKPYIPITTLRTVSKQYADQSYCQKAGFIYHDDMNIIDGVKYYIEDDLPYAIMNNLQYQIIKEDQYYKIIESNVDVKNNVIDIDIMSKYKIMKSRGCEDMIKDYSKNKTIEFLLKTFTDYFNPDVMKDIVFLYLYLYTCLIVLNYQPKLITKFNGDKLPKKSVLNEIYNMYNLLYVHITILD